MQFGKFKMPKDRVLSTKTFVVSHLIILILALAFFGGLYYILYLDKFIKDDFSYTPVTKEPVSLFLEITAPEDDILVTDGNLIVSGKTRPDVAIIISSNNTDIGLQAGKDGQFSRVFPLTTGPNIIEIVAFDQEGNSKSITKSVFFSEEKI